MEARAMDSFAVDAAAASSSSGLEEGKMEFLQESVSESNLPPLGRVLNVLLSAKSQELQFQNSKKGPSNKALVAFLRHAEFSARKGLGFDKLLVPLLQHVVKSRDRSKRKQVSHIMEWLLQQTFLRTAVVDCLTMIIRQNQFDNNVKLGWCIVVCDIFQQRIKMRQSPSGVWDAEVTLLTNCIPDLLLLMHVSSSKNMPTRLSLTAADCVILLSLYIADTANSLLEKTQTSEHRDNSQLIASSDLKLQNHLDNVNHLQLVSEVGAASTSGRPDITSKEVLLWNKLDSLVEFLFQLRKWNEISRPLHARGVLQIERGLKNLVHLRDTLENEDGMGAGGGDCFVLMAVLSTCWGRYGSLLLSEKFILSSESKVLLQQWIEGLQHSSQLQSAENNGQLSKRKADELRVFFLSCLALLLGRFGTEELESLLRDFGLELLHAVFGQLRGEDGEAVDIAVAIVRTLLFQTKLNNNEKFKMETIASSLIDLLDERDSTSKAVVVLIADYLAANPSTSNVERLFTILVSGSLAQRQNAICVLSELLNLLSSEDRLTSTFRQNIAAHLLKCLGDVELVNRLEVSRLFSKLDPNFVLPALVQQVYSRDEKVRSSASAAIVSVLRGHSNQCDALCVLLDCTSNMVLKASPPVHPGEISSIGSMGNLAPDVDRIMRLIPSWACEVKVWPPLIEMTLKKMFSEPSNPVFPRFLSEISTYLSDNVSCVFNQVLAFMVAQPEILDEVLQTTEGGLNQHEGKFDVLIFERLSPLLVLKVLPLVAFDNGCCHELYGGLPEATMAPRSYDTKSITQILFERACGCFEAHEVRKLSAELLGRCLPSIVLPQLTKRLEYAMQHQSILEAKSCLFALCNMILLRGKALLEYPSLAHTQRLLAEILLWPCLPTDEDTFKLQHGCIDCFALMVLMELADSKETEVSLQKKSKAISPVTVEVKAGYSENPKHPILLSIISCITNSQHDIPFIENCSWQQAENAAQKAIKESSVKELSIQTSFRLCMANVLIRATQKISIPEQKLLAMQVLPPIMAFVQDGRDPKLKSACLQILFSMVHNLKERVVPYAVDLLNLAIGILRSQAFEEERLAAARLLVSLLTSEDAVTREVAPYLSEALLVLESISRMDSSAELRAFCEKLLNCMKAPDLE